MGEVRFLRTIPHTGTRALRRHMKGQGTPYANSMHLNEPHFAQVVQWGLPVDVTVRDPRTTLISTFHHVMQARLKMYSIIHRWRDYPNVNLIKIEDTGIEPGETATPDYFGLRAKYIDGDEPFPEDVLAFMSPTVRDWLRAEFYEGL